MFINELGTAQNNEEIGKLSDKEFSALEKKWKTIAQYALEFMLEAGGKVPSTEEKREKEDEDAEQEGGGKGGKKKKKEAHDTSDGDSKDVNDKDDTSPHVTSLHVTVGYHK